MGASRLTPKRSELSRTNSSKKVAAAKRSPPRSLLLDNIVGVIDDFNQVYGLSAGTLSLDKMERDVPLIEDIVTKILHRTMEVNSQGVFAQQHPLLSKMGRNLDYESGGIPRYRIPLKSVHHNLRRVWEAALQTLTLLPDRTPVYGPKRVRLLSSHLSKLASQMQTALRFGDVRDRFVGEDQIRLLRLPVELTWTADALENALLTTELVNTDGRNPQVVFALYFVGWIEACTGRKEYESTKALMAAAFHAAGLKVPKWIDRLPIEMHYRLKRRKARMQRRRVSQSIR